MLPTQTNLHGHGWWQPPNVDYSFKHSFSWPQQQLADAAAAAQRAGAASTGAAAAESAAASAAAAAAAGTVHHTAHFSGVGTGGLPPRGPGGPGHYHWYGRGGYPRYGRFRGPRRLVWFGLGIAAAAWYFKRKERERDLKEAFASGNPPLKEWGWGCENVKRDGWGHGWNQGWHRPSPPPTPSTPTTPPVTNTIQPPTYAGPVKEAASSDVLTQSAVLAALSKAQTESQGAEEALPTQAGEQRSWGWGGRRRRRREAREEARQQQEQQQQHSTSVNENAAGVPVLSEKNQQSGEEMKRLREAVEDLWADRKGALMTAQERADQKAREYAREKIDKLSVALEGLRESLKADGEKKKDEKWV